jgi:hypothetical protein
MPLAVLVLIFNGLGPTGDALLGSRPARRRQRLGMRAEAFGKNAIDSISPTLVVADDLVRNVCHGSPVPLRRQLRPFSAKRLALGLDPRVVNGFPKEGGEAARRQNQKAYRFN